ncbi:hypothetical protein BCF33_2277 [Hasllibacter halocynthiae]|uniref:GlsB/YeaQ/YmgE family stress response membrane protein n=1 Tax=Hasllibacter halocynthiae TaxID=595589 RepID=A0A2T0X384_9RHOB|nr:hypothetical protein [Hasllibacter halocynthiae]PRY93409.1 hypothetical protein BCF33_2277 [Hasllibacter halocynthiae]
MFLGLFGSVVIAGIVGYLAEKWGWTHNGILPSIVIAVGGVFLLYFVRIMFGLRIGSPGVDAIIGAVGALALIPTEASYRRKQRKRR